MSPNSWQSDLAADALIFAALASLLTVWSKKIPLLFRIITVICALFCAMMQEVREQVPVLFWIMSLCWVAFYSAVASKALRNNRPGAYFQLYGRKAQVSLMATSCVVPVSFRVFLLVLGYRQHDPAIAAIIAAAMATQNYTNEDVRTLTALNLAYLAFLAAGEPAERVFAIESLLAAICLAFVVYFAAKYPPQEQLQPITA